MKVTYLAEPQSPAYERNFERYGFGGSEDYPCIVCAKPVSKPMDNYWAHWCHGGLASTEYGEGGCDGGCNANYPVGNSCARKYFTAEQRATYLVKST